MACIFSSRRPRLRLFDWSDSCCCCDLGLREGNLVETETRTTRAVIHSAPSGSRLSVYLSRSLLFEFCALPPPHGGPAIAAPQAFSAGRKVLLTASCCRSCDYALFRLCSPFPLPLSSSHIGARSEARAEAGGPVCAFGNLRIRPDPLLCSSPRHMLRSPCSPSAAQELPFRGAAPIEDDASTYAPPLANARGRPRRTSVRKASVCGSAVQGRAQMCTSTAPQKY